MSESRVNKIVSLADDLKYLHQEYLEKKINANRDGEVEFNSLVEYLSNEDNASMVEHLIKVARFMNKMGIK